MDRVLAKVMVSSSVLHICIKEDILTLLDMLKIAKHYAVKVILALLAFALVGAAVGSVKVFMSGERYSAESVITVSEPTATISASELIPLLEAIAENQAALLSDAGTIETDGYIGSRTIHFVVSAPTADESVALANDVARMTIDAAELRFGEMATKYQDAAMTGGTSSGESAGEFLALSNNIEKNRAAAYETVSMVLNEAVKAKNELGLTALAKFAVVGLVVGLLLVCCALVLIGVFNAPIPDKAEIERRFNLPVICNLGDTSPSERLWTNIVFAAEESPRTICLLPVDTAPASHLVGGLQQAAMKLLPIEAHKEDVQVIACESIEKNALSVCEARNADVTVLCVVPWSDSVKQMAEVVEELELAQANVIGVVLGRQNEYVQ